MSVSLKQIEDHLRQVRSCTSCPNMVGPVVTPQPVLTRVYLCGQAPGPHEGRLGKPFAWTAGKTLFKWLGSIGLDEESFRQLAFMGAVCRCFPGKAAAGGDRVPSPQEIQNCSEWMQREFRLLQPTLVLPVGRLAIDQFMPATPLVDVIGKKWSGEKWGQTFDLIPLPHPSGASTWFKRDPGKTLLAEALQLLKAHEAWQELCKTKALV